MVPSSAVVMIGSVTVSNSVRYDCSLSRNEATASSRRASISRATRMEATSRRRTLSAVRAVAAR